MSSYGKHGIQKAMDAAAKIAIQRYMQRDDAEKLQALRDTLKGESSSRKSGSVRH